MVYQIELSNENKNTEEMKRHSFLTGEENENKIGEHLEDVFNKLAIEHSV